MQNIFIWLYRVLDKLPNDAAKGELTKGVSMIPPLGLASSGRVGLNRGGRASLGASEGAAEESTFWLIVEDDVVLSALGGEVYLKQ